MTKIESLISFVKEQIERFEAVETFFGFADAIAAQEWVEADKASHKPGPKRKAV